VCFLAQAAEAALTCRLSSDQPLLENSADMSIAKILRFGHTRTNIGVDLYNLLDSNVPLTYVTPVRRDVGNPQSALDALREVQHADRLAP
jgi:hypothetical protein